MNFDTKNAWHDALAAILPILDSVQYKVYTWFCLFSASYQIGTSNPSWWHESLRPIVVELQSVSWLEFVTAWGVIMLAVERTFAAFIRINQWRRERHLSKRRSEPK